MILFPPDSFFGDSPSVAHVHFMPIRSSKNIFVGPEKDQTVFNALLVLFNEHYCRHGISEGPRGTRRKYWRVQVSK